MGPEDRNLGFGSPVIRHNTTGTTAGVCGDESLEPQHLVDRSFCKIICDKMVGILKADAW